MNLDALANLLQVAGLGQVGKSIFVHDMPQVSQAILFRLPLSGVEVCHELPGYYKHSLQVIVRDPISATAEARAKQVVETLTMAETEIGGMYVRFIRPKSLPIVYPRSEGREIEVSLNLDCAWSQV